MRIHAIRRLGNALAAGLPLALALGCAGSGGDAPVKVEPKHIILFIGDGMQLEHEIAASRYLTGTDRGLVWQGFPTQAQVCTWDVSTYDRYALASGAANYTDQGFLPRLGYDETRGGALPCPDQPTPDPGYFLTPLRKSAADSLPYAPATDSASAGTAMACGYKTDDGNIAWLPKDPKAGGNRANDGSLLTIAELFRQHRGGGIGVVSTVPFNHATPASFVAHNVSRNNYYTGRSGYTGLGIADEIIHHTRPEVVIGGGHPQLDNPFYNTSKGYLSKPLHDHLRTSQEWVFAERQTGVDGSQTLAQAAERAVREKKRLFGLFGGPGGNFEPPVPAHTPGAPSLQRGSLENPLLKDAAVAALQVLSQNPKGFFLMVEQGDIDWANHANDYRWMIGTMWDLDQAIRATLDYIDRPGDTLTRENTLILVTSDHGNSYMRHNPAKPLGHGELPQQVPTAPLKGHLVWDDRRETLVIQRGDGSLERLAYASPWSYPGGEITYGTGDHTNELVTLAVQGTPSDHALVKAEQRSWYRFGNVLDNTQIFRVLRDASGLPSVGALPTPKP